MKSFTIVQNLLTAMVVPFLAAIVGLASVSGIYIFWKIQSLWSGNDPSLFMHDIDKVPWEQFAITGVAAGMGIMAWGITLVIISGLLGGLFRPRLEPGRYPLQSFLTIQWAWSMVFHRIALFFLPFLVPSFIGNTYYWLSGAKLGKGVQINSAHLNDAGSVTLGDRVVIGGKAIINAHLTEKGELVMAPVSIGNDALIGMGSVIQPGCTIGNGAVVASRAVVPKWTNIPEGEVWAGIPARCIKLADGSKPE
ncbi:MAG: DapH/DapD/GlmU-related protein [Candidatus Thalassarchaeaceae archaeon]|jgi:acetyltransferase-like isoleucine patch superfamily enzyme|nr:DapH/DapD/GlmU-related protein [Candidatus Thalassarchaeaceae archaeon]